MFAVPSLKRAGNSYKCGADRIDGRENPHKVRRSMVARSRRHSLETTREGTRLPCVAVEDVSLQSPQQGPSPYEPPDKNPPESSLCRVGLRGRFSPLR